MKVDRVGRTAAAIGTRHAAGLRGNGVHAMCQKALETPHVTDVCSSTMPCLGVTWWRTVMPLLIHRHSTLSLWLDLVADSSTTHQCSSHHSTTSLQLHQHSPLESSHSLLSAHGLAEMHASCFGDIWLQDHGKREVCKRLDTRLTGRRVLPCCSVHDLEQ